MPEVPEDGHVDAYQTLVQLQQQQDSDEKTRSLSEGKYGPLAVYLHTRNDLFITLSFARIEEILHDTLPPSAYSSRAFWQKQGFGTISASWLGQGYAFHNVHLDKKKLVLKRTQTARGSVRIPAVFLNEKIPEDARYELEEFFAYIKRKYGL